MGIAMELYRVPAGWTNSSTGELLDRLAELEWQRDGDEITSIDLEQAWDILDPLVAGASDDESAPQALAINGGALLGDRDDFPAVLALDPEEVRRVSDFLASTSFDDLLRRNRAAVDAGVRFDWTMMTDGLRDYFGEVAQFYASAAGAGEAVVKVIS